MILLNLKGDINKIPIIIRFFFLKIWIQNMPKLNKFTDKNWKNILRLFFIQQKTSRVILKNVNSFQTSDWFFKKKFLFMHDYF